MNIFNLTERWHGMKKPFRGQVCVKGALFPPREVRDAVGLKPGGTVEYRVEGGRLVVVPVQTLPEVFARRRSVTITREEVRRVRAHLLSGVSG